MPTDRQSDRSRGRREEIRQVAYRCFRDHGYHETSVDMICREAGISKGSLYWHYESKQDIFIDILNTWANQVMEELWRQFEAALEQPDYLRAIAEGLGREIHRGRAVVPVWLEYTEHARRDPEVQKALSKFFRRARSAIVEMLRPVFGDRYSDAQLKGLATAIFGAYVGLMVQDLCDPEGADAADAVTGTVSVLDAWLRAAGSAGG